MHTRIPDLTVFNVPVKTGPPNLTSRCLTSTEHLGDIVNTLSHAKPLAKPYQATLNYSQPFGEVMHLCHLCLSSHLFPSFRWEPTENRHQFVQVSADPTWKPMDVLLCFPSGNFGGLTPQPQSVAGTEPRWDGKTCTTLGAVRWHWQVQNGEKQMWFDDIDFNSSTSRGRSATF